MSWGAAHQASLSITNFQGLLKLMFIKLMMPPNDFIFCLPLYLLPLIFPGIRVFSNKLILPIRWLKYWMLSFSIGPSKKYSRLISFRVDWLDLLAVQGDLKSLVQHHSLKTSVLWCLCFFMIQLSDPSQLLAKSVLTIQTFAFKQCLCFLVCCLGFS